jgi:DNA polymerase elongation subunit (family B)
MPKAKPHVVPPKVIFFDIESSPNIAYVWGKYEQNVIGDYLQERKIISVSWKWLGSKKVESMSIPDFYGYKDTTRVVNSLKNRKLIFKLHEVLSPADIIVAQNGDNFDIKMSNAEFIQYGLSPLPPYKTIDTLKIARAKFSFNSNKLDDLGKRLGLGEKVHTGGFGLWVGCLKGDKKSWDKMIEYNKQDVLLLEKIYLKFRPWMTNHPNMNVFDGIPGCPVCKSTHVTKQGWGMTALGRRRQYQCQNCGKWSSGKLEKAGLELR